MRDCYKFQKFIIIIIIIYIFLGSEFQTASNQIIRHMPKHIVLTIILMTMILMIKIQRFV